MYAWISSPENVPRTTLRSDQVPSAENNWSGQNYTGYSNPEMDRLLDAIEVELDRGDELACPFAISAQLIHEPERTTRADRARRWRR